VDRDEAFREFVLGQAGSLRRLAYAVTGDWHRADDLVQGALERAYVHWHRVAAADEPGAYVRTILVRLAASEGRRSWRRREHLAEQVPEMPGTAEDERAGERIDLARLLAGLTVKQRAVMVLRFLEDRPVHEVAAVLGVAEGTVKRQTHDALERLRSLLPSVDVMPATEVPHA
jgi:RNA polymerase sigma-70 factor (sigma-E family)